MKYIVKIEEDAQLDIEEATLWYEERNPQKAEEFADEVYNTIEQLSIMPKIYQIVFKTIRRAVLNTFPFSIFFKILKKNVHILGVIHESRNPDIWKEKF